MSANLALKSAAAVIETAHLKDALAKAKEVIEKRNTIPILSHIHLTSDKDRLFITGTDLDLYITIAVPATVEPGYNITANVHNLFDLVKNAPKGSMTTLTQAPNSQLLVDFGGRPMQIHTLPSDDFPVDCVKVQEPSTFVIPGKSFWDGLDATMFAISTEETRYYLNGIYMHRHHDTNELMMVTTDGHRLAHQSLSVFDFGLARGVIIPRKTSKVLHKMMKGKACPKDITIEVPKGDYPLALRFQWGDITVTSKMVDGTFPDYPRVVPSDSYTTIVATIDNEALTAGVKQVGAISSERGRAVKMTFTDGNKLTLYVNNPDTGAAVYDLEVSYQRLDPLKPGDTDIFEIGVNFQYLTELLAAAGKGNVSFRFQDAGSPIKTLGSRKDWYGVLMPMRV